MKKYYNKITKNSAIFQRKQQKSAKNLKIMYNL